MRDEQQRWPEAEVERLAPLEAIVRAAAERDPLANIAPEYDDYVCLMCPDDHEDDVYRSTPAEVVHHEACPWRQAKAWVEANPGAATPPQCAPDEHPL